jgi:hypothetical protein
MALITNQLLTKVSHGEMIRNQRPRLWAAAVVANAVNTCFFFFLSILIYFRTKNTFKYNGYHTLNFLDLQICQLLFGFADMSV